MNILEAYRNSTILVTGGAGAIGSQLCQRLVGLDADVVIVDDLSSGQKLNIPKNATFVEGDILQDAVLDKAFGFQPRKVFHLAALFANQNSVEHPYDDLMVNGMGTLRVLERCNPLHIDRFVYSSSSSVYDSTEIPAREGAVTAWHRTPYQITKLLGEMYCNFHRAHRSLNTTILRFFNSYGPGEMGGRYRNVIPNFIARALSGRPLTITGTGEETRDFTFVGDIVDGLLRAGAYESAVGQVFNLGTGIETRIIDLASMINEITGNHGGVEFANRRPWDNKPRRAACIDKARDMLGYSPGTDLRGGLQTTVEWFQQCILL